MGAETLRRGILYCFCCLLLDTRVVLMRASIVKSCNDETCIQHSKESDGFSKG